MVGLQEGQVVELDGTCLYTAVHLLCKQHETGITCSDLAAAVAWDPPLGMYTCTQPC